MTTPIKPTHDMPAPTAIRLFLMDRLLDFQSSASGLLENERSIVVESVHDLRVICRQILSVLEAFSPWLHVNKLKLVTKEVRRINGLLGPVRDLDILLTEPEQVFSCRDAIERQRKDALERLLLACSDKALKKTMSAMMHLLLMPDIEIRLIPVPITDKGRVLMVRLGPLVPAVLFRLAAGITAYRVVIPSPPDEAPSPEALHQLRIQCKAFRYTVAMLRPLLGQPADDLIRSFKELQDLLGMIHDQELLAHVLAESNKERVASTDRSVDAALSAVHMKQHLLLEEFLVVWQKMDASWFVKRIGQAIDHMYGQSDWNDISAESPS